jgi:phosphatidate cytidylyltransferase
VILMAAAVVAVMALEFALTSRSSRAVILCLLVCVFDGFSQIFGQLFGRTKLAPSISPSKTVEGAVGGCLAVMAFALFLDRPEVALPYALGTAGAALIGDLAASLVKRLCGIKDYSDLLPGHGGVLDRFDGLFAAAAFWAFIGLLVS